MSEENNNAMMLMMAKSLLDLNKIPALDEVFKQIDLITAQELREISEEALVVRVMFAPAAKVRVSVALSATILFCPETATVLNVSVTEPEDTKSIVPSES